MYLPDSYIFLPLRLHLGEYNINVSGYKYEGCKLGALNFAAERRSDTFVDCGVMPTFVMLRRKSERKELRGSTTRRRLLLHLPSRIL